MNTAEMIDKPDFNSSQVIKKPLFRYFLFFAFFITGASGLIYQVLWSRLLILTFGYSIYSISVVVAAFMGGLAIGSILGGTLADRLKSPIVAYALSELGIGIMAVITYPLLTGLPEILAKYREVIYLPYYGFSPWALIISLAILLPPTILMGLTLPLLARTLTRGKKNAAIDIGGLYSVNTIGAAIGSIMAGFLLIAILGVSRTLFLAASLNIIIGLVSLLLYRYIPSNNVARDASRVNKGAPSILMQPVTWAFGISGFVSLGVEVIWIRIFSPYLENSTYAFSLILGIFLAGIAFGGWVVRRFASSWTDSTTGYGICQLMVGLTTGLGLILLFSFIGYFHSVLPWVGVLLDDPSLIFKESVGIALILFPSTFFMGAGFPFIAQWAAGEFGRLGIRTGKLYAINTVGSVLGSIVAAFLFLPLLGTRDSLILLSLLSLAAGFFLLYTSRNTLFIKPKYLIILGVLLVSFIMLLRLNSDPNLFAIKNAYRGRKILAYKEDPDVNVTLMGRGNMRELYINLKLVSGSGVGLTPWMTHLPLFLYNDGPPSKMLNIGLGIGTTFSSALQHPGLEVDVAELIPSVVDLFSEFHPRGKQILENPRGRVIVGDGRNYLLSAKKPYDIIVIDPTPPLYGSGAVNLYTADFFRLVTKKLSPKGILLLRIPASADRGSIKLLLRTAIEVFPHVSLWKPPFRDMGFSLIASPSAQTFDPEDLSEKVKSATIFTDQVKDTLLRTQPIFIGENEQLLKELNGIPVVTDDRPYLEFPLFF